MVIDGTGISRIPNFILAIGQDGVARVGGTRVRLDTIIYAFNQGATAEEILQQYPSLSLSDIYATISYYLQNRASVDAYLEERHQNNEEAKRQNESRFDPAGVRERLLKRAKSRRS